MSLEEGHQPPPRQSSQDAPGDVPNKETSRLSFKKLKMPWSLASVGGCLRISGRARKSAAYRAAVADAISADGLDKVNAMSLHQVCKRINLLYFYFINLTL